jgi:cytochrome d ubiquinol oxidase subunit II
MESFLPYLWFGFFALTALLFVLLGGADLGIGILSLGARARRRSEMLNAMGPLWYANETWLVIAGAILFAAFPIVYAIILSSLYIPAMALIFGLILRAVSVELRAHSQDRGFWETAIGAGSLVAALAQGLLLGGLLARPQVADGVFAGGPWDWLGATSIASALAAVAGYAMLGAIRLVGAVPDASGRHERRPMRASALCAAILFAAAAGVTAASANRASGSMLTEPPRLLLAGLFVLAGLVGFIMLMSASRRSGAAPAAGGMLMFLGAAGLILAATLPYAVPYSITIRDAASPAGTLIVMLYGVGFFLPVIIAYNLFARIVFRGKGYGTEGKSDHETTAA